MEQEMKVEFMDFGREPKCAPNPAYPDGIDVDMSHDAAKTCVAVLPYPAPRYGAYIVECPKCGLRVALTTAGRPDDPRSVKVGCRPTFQ